MKAKRKVKGEAQKRISEKIPVLMKEAGLDERRISLIFGIWD